MSEFNAQMARKAHFSSGLKYLNPDLSEKENRALFGKLYSPNGFGYNFCLEAFVSGPIHAETGLIMDITHLDRAIKEVISPLDHRFLNTDVEEFKEKVPSTENIAAYCFTQLQAQLKDEPVKLNKVRIYESDFKWAEYGPEL